MDCSHVLSADNLAINENTTPVTLGLTQGPTVSLRTADVRSVFPVTRTKITRCVEETTSSTATSPANA
jgi:hypothetical protein